MRAVWDSWQNGSRLNFRGDYYKLTLMAHSPSHYQEMGRLVAGAGSSPWDDLAQTYGRSLMDGLQEAQGASCIRRWSGQ